MTISLTNFADNFELTPKKDVQKYNLNEIIHLKKLHFVFKII